VLVQFLERFFMEGSMERKDFCYKIYGVPCKEGCKYVNDDFKDCLNYESNQQMIELLRYLQKEAKQREAKEKTEFHKEVDALKKGKSKKAAPASNVVFADFRAGRQNSSVRG
jgi:hypothetical protein